MDGTGTALLGETDRGHADVEHHIAGSHPDAVPQVGLLTGELLHLEKQLRGVVLVHLCECLDPRLRRSVAHDGQ
ncbi:MAG: hypothetical protein NVSMB51_17220 [Solirubrobacteraceae bacterium]